MDESSSQTASEQDPVQTGLLTLLTWTMEPCAAGELRAVRTVRSLDGSDIGWEVSAVANAQPPFSIFTVFQQLPQVNFSGETCNSRTRNLEMVFFHFRFGTPCPAVLEALRAQSLMWLIWHCVWRNKKKTVQYKQHVWDQLHRAVKIRAERRLKL